MESAVAGIGSLGYVLHAGAWSGILAGYPLPAGAALTPPMGCFTGPASWQLLGRVVCERVSVSHGLFPASLTLL